MSGKIKSQYKSLQIWYCKFILAHTDERRVVQWQSSKKWANENSRIIYHWRNEKKCPAAYAPIKRARHANKSTLHAACENHINTGKGCGEIPSPSFCVASWTASGTPDEWYCTLQLYGAMAYMSHETMNMLHEFFNDWLISIGLWPPCSPTSLLPIFFAFEDTWRIGSTATTLRLWQLYEQTLPKKSVRLFRQCCNTSHRI